MELSQAIREAQKHLRGMRSIEQVIEAFDKAQSLVSLLNEKEASVAAIAEEEKKLTEEFEVNEAMVKATMDEMALDLDAAKMKHRRELLAMTDDLAKAKVAHADAMKALADTQNNAKAELAVLAEQMADAQAELVKIKTQIADARKQFKAEFANILNAE